MFVCALRWGGGGGGISSRTVYVHAIKFMGGGGGGLCPRIQI